MTTAGPSGLRESAPSHAVPAAAPPTPAQPQTHQHAQLTSDNVAHNDSILSLIPDTATPSDSDVDSAFDAYSSASTSITSSILHYEYSNGRRYQGYRSGAYVLPNDDEEQDRLDLLHHIFLLCLGGKLYDAPIGHTPERVLDIGTGTGIWSIDFGDENPGAEVLGTDLSPIQPSWVPPNVKFYIDDAEADWIYPPQEAFDLIHSRGMSGAINDWDRLIQQSYEHLAPGGWLEFQEPEAWVQSDDDTMSRAKNIDQWQKLCNDAAAKFGKEIRIGHTLKERLEKQGFVNVHERIIKVPVGHWPKDPTMKEIGRYQREHMAMGVEPYTFGFIGKVLGWTEAECKVMTAKVVNEVRDKSLHLYIRFYFVYGQKPQSAAH